MGFGVGRGLGIEAEAEGGGKGSEKPPKTEQGSQEKPDPGAGEQDGLQGRARTLQKRGEAYLRTYPGG